MMQLFLEGGFPMWFLLLFGAGALVSAGMFARRPERERLPLLFSLVATLVFVAIMGVFTNLASAGHHIADHFEDCKADLTRILLQTFAEAIAPGVLGFGLVSLVAMITVVGFYREARGA